LEHTVRRGRSQSQGVGGADIGKAGIENFLCELISRERLRMKRTGVYVCHCGGNISEVVDIKSVVECAEKQSDVVLVKDHEHMCSETGQIN